MTKKLHIHFIGICGVAMSAVAIALKNQGHTISGSDAGFFPPISDHLKKHQINFYPGWHPEKMIADGVPDLVIVGNVASSSNPEWLYVQEKKLPYLSYPEAIAKFFIKKNSIVCAGTYGKTSSTTLLSYILSEARLDPSYMFGALAVNNIDAAKIGNGDFSVVEGDEYKSARWDRRPKFAHYSPNHLLLGGLNWDHADIYPTAEEYFSEFKKLLNSLPADGLLIACIDEDHVKEILPHSKAKTITYGSAPDADYKISHISEIAEGLDFTITQNGNTTRIKSPMLGKFQAFNITGCFAMAREIGIEEKTILAAIKDFHGIKRRLEKRFAGDITVFDDIAHSPAKAASTLQTLRSIYRGKIIAIFEPNTGNRRPESKVSYANAFRAANLVIIPELTKLKKDATETEAPFDGQKLAEIISETHKNVNHIPDDEKLINFVADVTKAGDVVVFLGSHGFRGMIEKLISKCNQ